MLRTQLLFGAAVVGLTMGIIIAATPDALAQGVIGEWSSVKPPALPELKSVTLDPKTTALVIMDFGETNCTERAPRCIAALPHLKAVLDKARASHALVVYCGFPNWKAFRSEVAPIGGEPPMVTGGGNKFHGSDLDKILKEHGIKSVVLAGTQPGTVLFTGGEAAWLGYKVVVPVDTMPGNTLYSEQVVVWGLEHDPGLAGSVLTTAAQINF